MFIMNLNSISCVELFEVFEIETRRYVEIRLKICELLETIINYWKISRK